MWQPCLSSKLYDCHNAQTPSRIRIALDEMAFDTVDDAYAQLMDTCTKAWVEAMAEGSLE